MLLVAVIRRALMRAPDRRFDNDAAQSRCVARPLSFDESGPQMAAHPSQLKVVPAKLGDDESP
jgi:hypothetical protein